MTMLQQLLCCQHSVYLVLVHLMPYLVCQLFVLCMGTGLRHHQWLHACMHGLNRGAPLCSMQPTTADAERCPAELLCCGPDQYLKKYLSW
jgi:hypothetical protein